MLKEFWRSIAMDEVKAKSIVAPFDMVASDLVLCATLC